MTETFHNYRKNPCKGCPDRYPACSGHCEKPDFLEWKAEQALIRKNKQAYYPPSWKHPEPTQKARSGPRRRKN